MAEEEKEKPAEEAKKDAPKEGAEAAAPADGAKKKKGLPIFAIGMGGGGAAIIGMAYFLTVAAVETGASVLPQLAPIAGEEKKTEDPPKPAEGDAAKADDGHGGAKPQVDEHGNPIPAEAAKPAAAGSPFVELTEIMTNTRGASQKRFVAIKIGMTIEAPDTTESAKKIQTGEGNGAILDMLIGMLRSKTIEDLEGGGANRDLLKREIKEIVNRVAFPKGEGRVKEVFILKLMVQ